MTFVIVPTEEQYLSGIYKKAVDIMNRAKTRKQYLSAAEKFVISSRYSDSDLLATECFKKAEECRKDSIYNKARFKMFFAKSEYDYSKAVTLFRMIPNWKDSEEQIYACYDKIGYLMQQNESNRKENAKIYDVAFTVLVVIVAIFLLFLLAMHVLPPFHIV